ncbi:MAG: hypothetical protein GY948_10670 [Alphaproteobacteria bacterium]|nr:hypothetical protein [Alphaproteobacteria bacterium]
MLFTVFHCACPFIDRADNALAGWTSFRQLSQTVVADESMARVELEWSAALAGLPMNEREGGRDTSQPQV